MKPRLGGLKPRLGGLELPKPTLGMSRWRQFNSHFDWPLFVAVFLIAGLGLLNLYSATHGTRHAAKFDQQVIRMGVGMLAFFAFTFLDYRMWVRVAWFLFWATILAIVVVALLGDHSLAKGSQRWIAYGPVRIQPSELAKIAVILVMAKLFQEHDAANMSWKQLIFYAGLLSLPVFLIAMQPDLGSSILTLLIILSIGFLAASKLWPIVSVTLFGLAMIPVLWENMHDYQKQRVLAFLDPSADPSGAGWHTRQSIYAVGSGRVSGKGFMEGTQNQFDFLPEHWTDFPFSVWAEEWGFIGSVVLLAIFGFLIVWTVNNALVARDKCGAIICIGAAAMLFWHLVVNLAMVLGMAPVVGVTLPFISYGGSSLLAFFVAMGLVSSVSLRRHGF